MSDILKKYIILGFVKKLNLRTFSSGRKPIVFKKNNEAIILKTDVNLFS